MKSETLDCSLEAISYLTKLISVSFSYVFGLTKIIIAYENGALFCWNGTNDLITCTDLIVGDKGTCDSSDQLASMNLNGVKYYYISISNRRFI